MSNSIEKFHDSCCGCGVCAERCPKGAIKMLPNRQGFYYPVISSDACVDCGVCAQVCSFHHAELKSLTNQRFYVAKNQDSSVREKSRSGGVFTALSDYVLSMNGTIYGCKMADCKTAVHARATSKEERDRFLGSKYIQSTIFSVLNQIREDLQQGKNVLFSGTACQVNAVKQYCKDLDCSKLILVDIVCHGVPSPRIWGDYIDYLEQKEKKKIVSVDFRDKARYGWSAHHETVTFEDGGTKSGHIFRDLFYGHLVLRKSCFVCPYKSTERVSDLTLADAWGIKRVLPSFDDDKGVSLVLANTGKGKRLFETVQKDLVIQPVEIDGFLQPPLKENWSILKEYDSFWEY